MHLAGQLRAFAGEHGLCVQRPLVLFVPLFHHHVQLNQRADLRDGNEVIAAETADVALHPTLLVGAGQAGRQ
ncbi:hypothetical protein ACFY4I_39115 [Streptomyces scabiei]|uniref:hypothetical protein n=1 Tax=Streptomyces scabiei TaxID=1930 RepID=UPI00367B7805